MSETPHPGHQDRDPHEYCVVHDQPLGWCPHPARCREIMTSWGLYATGGGGQDDQ
jgi:hypothetical protein